MSKPGQASERAVEAAVSALFRNADRADPGAIERVARAMHDPALGLDRSVCLREVVEAIRGMAGRIDTPDHRERQMATIYAADFIEREFGDNSGNIIADEKLSNDSPHYPG